MSRKELASYLHCLTLVTLKSSVRKKQSHAGIKESAMNSIIYIVGLVVVVLFVLSFLGMR